VPQHVAAAAHAEAHARAAGEFLGSLQRPVLHSIQAPCSGRICSTAQPALQRWSIMLRQLWLTYHYVHDGAGGDPQYSNGYSQVALQGATGFGHLRHAPPSGAALQALQVAAYQSQMQVRRCRPLYSHWHSKQLGWLLWVQISCSTQAAFVTVPTQYALNQADTAVQHAYELCVIWPRDIRLRQLCAAPCRLLSWLQHPQVEPMALEHRHQWQAAPAPLALSRQA
jgi:hypothetical protein